MTNFSINTTFVESDPASYLRNNFNPRRLFIRKQIQPNSRNLITDIIHPRNNYHPNSDNLSPEPVINLEYKEFEVKSGPNEIENNQFSFNSTNSLEPVFYIAQKSPKLNINKHKVFQMSLACFGVLMIAGGGYLSLLGFKANSIAEVQAKNLTSMVNNSGNLKTASVIKSSVPSTNKLSASIINNYLVAPNMPRYLSIPKLGVHARILSVGVTSSGALATPSNVFDTAWYNESSLPGQPGAMLIDGHVSSWTTQGVFYGIKNLTPGNIIQVVRGDGTIFSYSVVKSQIYPASDVNMSSAMTPIVAGQPGLNLITCTGDVIPGTSEFNERIMVYATLNPPAK